jgi:hypothetical protein
MIPCNNSELFLPSPFEGVPLPLTVPLAAGDVPLAARRLSSPTEEFTGGGSVKADMLTVARRKRDTARLASTGGCRGPTPTSV